MTFIQRRLYPKLEKSGVTAYEYLPSMMHAKTMLIDDRLSVVGSMNLDFLSMEWLEEGLPRGGRRPLREGLRAAVARRHGALATGDRAAGRGRWRGAARGGLQASP